MLFIKILKLTNIEKMYKNVPPDDHLVPICQTACVIFFSVHNHLSANHHNLQTNNYNRYILVPYLGCVEMY